MPNLEPSVWCGPDVRAPKTPLTPEQLDSFRPGNIPFHVAEAEAELKRPITPEQRVHNKAVRLRHAGSPTDGLTVRFLKTCSSGAVATTGVIASNLALKLISEGIAESAE
jgi:hypothetical protein